MAGTKSKIKKKKGCIVKVDNADIAFHEYMHSNWDQPYLIKWVKENCSEEEKQKLKGLLWSMDEYTAFHRIK